MKLSYALILAGSLAFVACGGDSNPSSAQADCSVTGGVKVVSPAAGETFKLNDEITVVYGTDVDDSGYRVYYYTSDDAEGVSLTSGSVGLDRQGDGKTCYELKVKLDSEIKGVVASTKAFIRVIPYNRSRLYGASGKFTVKE